jgi:hypothetical protein
MNRLKILKTIWMRFGFGAKLGKLRRIKPLMHSVAKWEEEKKFK